jgi:hypothetical protein
MNLETATGQALPKRGRYAGAFVLRSAEGRAVFRGDSAGKAQGDAPQTTEQ